jgi:four helix bundle protein
VGARTYRELHVWRVLDDLRRQVWVLSRDQAFDSQPWLRSQLRRAAHSCCANVAEGFARYRPREFARFVEIARASVVELTEHLRAPLDPAPPVETMSAVLRQAAHADRALTNLVRYLKSPRAYRHDGSDGGARGGADGRSRGGARGGADGRSRGGAEDGSVDRSRGDARSKS